MIMNRDDIDQGPDLYPGQLSFYLGSFSDGSCLVRWDGRSLIVEKTGGGNFNGVSRRFHPEKEQWEEFWHRVNELGVWSWDASYSAPHGCSRVTYWQFALSRGRETISTSGEDLLPDGRGPESSVVLVALIDAIKVLCRE